MEKINRKKRKKIAGNGRLDSVCHLRSRICRSINNNNRGIAR
ncbi:MAG: hypothetical protein NT118_07315 [Lentisphaerae bacterium]|nr:hypothetical protein [Lentisphaerota bacterium]